MNRVESRKNRVPSPEKNGKRRRTGMAMAQRARDLVPHGPLTTTVRWRSSPRPLHILLFVLPLIRRYTASLLRAFHLALPPRATRAPPRRWRWLIVAPLSRDNEISVCATRPPAGATLSFLYLRSFDTPLPAPVMDRRFCLRGDAFYSLLGISRSLRKESVVGMRSLVNYEMLRECH